MERKILFIIALVMSAGSLFLSCTKNLPEDTRIEERLELERLIYSHPDSMLQVLEQQLDSNHVTPINQHIWNHNYSLAKKLSPMTEAQREASWYEEKASRHYLANQDSLELDCRWKALNAYRKDTVMTDEIQRKIRYNYIQMGRTYTRIKQYDKGMAVYRACQNEPLCRNIELDSIFPIMGMGEIHQRMKAYDSALIYFQKALTYVGEKQEYWDGALRRAIYRNYLLEGDTATARQYHQDMMKGGYYISDEEPNYLSGNNYIGMFGFDKYKASKKNTDYLYYIMAVMVMTLSVVTYLFFKQRKAKQPSVSSPSEPQESGCISLEESLQTGIRNFYATPWHGRLETSEKEIVPGDYMKLDEQKQLFQTLDTCFQAFIDGMNISCPGINKEDIYYCILSHLDYRNRTIVFATRVSSGALRTRKSRLKKVMPEDVFLLIFG